MNIRTCFLVMSLLPGSACALAATEGVPARIFDGPGFATGGTVTPPAAIDATWPASPVTGERTPFSVLWQGSIRPRFAEPYTLYVKAAGRWRLFLDGVLVKSGSSESATTTSLPLGAVGLQPRLFRLEYSDWDGSGRCSLCWRSASEGPLEVPVPATQLARLHALVAAIPSTSTVSPVCIPFERPYAATVSCVGSQPGTVAAIDACSGWADVPLSRMGPTPVRLKLERGPSLVGTVGWTATDVAAGGSRTVRRHDALLLSSPHDGMLRLSRPDGQTEVLPVTAAAPVAKSFDIPGAWGIAAEDAAGIGLGSIAVQVADIALPARMACEVNWKRSVQSPATPADGIQVALAQSLTGSVGPGPVVAGRCGYWLKPAASGSQALVFRIASGSILAACPVDAYRVGSNIYTGNFVFARDEQGYGHGMFRLEMTPRLEYPSILLDFFVTTVRIGGLSRIEIAGSSLAADGSWSAPFVVSPNQSRSCHRINVTQEMPDAILVPPNAVARVTREPAGQGWQP